MSGRESSLIMTPYGERVSTTFLFQAGRNRVAIKLLQIFQFLSALENNLACGKKTICIFLEVPVQINCATKVLNQACAAYFQRASSHVDFKFCWLLKWNQCWWSEEVYLFGRATAAKGVFRLGSSGFIDGSARPIAQTRRTKNECFSSHKRLRCPKWQSTLCRTEWYVVCRGAPLIRRMTATYYQQAGESRLCNGTFWVSRRSTPFAFMAIPIMQELTSLGSHLWKWKSWRTWPKQ